MIAFGLVDGSRSTETFSPPFTGLIPTIGILRRSMQCGHQLRNTDMPDPQYQRVVTTALAVFNDAILRVAMEHALPVIDLRAICINPADYANPIEPSSVGGDKIARAIAGLVTGSKPSFGATRIFIG